MNKKNSFKSKMLNTREMKSHKRPKKKGGILINSAVIRLLMKKIRPKTSSRRNKKHLKLKTTERTLKISHIKKHKPLEGYCV